MERRIESLEKVFSNLRKRIQNELKCNENITVQEFLLELTLLPVTLKKEYERSVLKRLKSMREEEQVIGLFLHLNPLFTFLDYGLLEHIINVFGSDQLKKDMKSYCNNVLIFMKQTTVKQIIHHLPGEEKTPQSYTKLKAHIKEDPSTYTLQQLNTLRRKYCSKIGLYETLCVMIVAEEFKSFLVVWLVPSILVSMLLEATRCIEGSFFQRENILSLCVGERWLYNSILSSYSSYMKQRYLQSTTIPPIQWLPSPTRKIFRLAMIQREEVQHGQIDDRFVLMTITGRIDDILHVKRPVEIEDIFKLSEDEKSEGEQKVVLIEGAPGSGKSTLTVHICQRWGKGELFQQFIVLILVQLRDPMVQSAQTVADLLPCQNYAMAQQAAAEIMAVGGRGVLWVLDGWDELPLHLKKNSIFQKLIYSHHEPEHFLQTPQSKTLLPESGIIVTSRPISSGDLHPVASSRIEVLGFSPEEQKQYFSDCLKGDTNALTVLFDRLQENPVLQSSCYLPLNAAFIVCSFKVKGYSLPSSEYEIFSTVILNCVLRHYERENRKLDLPLESLDQLSRNKVVGESFQCLCKLAYHGIMENKITFSSSDFPHGLNTLSLLQGVKSFLSGTLEYYNFLHLSVQEVLAAYHIGTQLPASEQVSKFLELFSQPRFSAVFQFYAAITKLKIPEIQKVIADIVVQKKSNFTQHCVLLSSLLHCLYNAKDPSLCHFVAKRLKGRLDFRSSSPNPLDYISIGYFLSSVSDTTDREFTIDISDCFIGDQGTKSLMRSICHDQSHTTNRKKIAHVDLNLTRNEIQEDGGSHIAVMLGTCSVVSKLKLQKNPIGDKGLKSILASLLTNSSLTVLDLTDCSLEITKEDSLIFTEMLQKNKTLHTLYVSRNLIGHIGLYSISKGLITNSSLVELYLSNCSLEITEEVDTVVTEMLQTNKTLRKLYIPSNPLADIGASFIAKSLKLNDTLTDLSLENCDITLRETDILNSTLKVLRVGENPLGDKGVGRLAELLKHNQSLRRLLINKCGVTDIGMVSLADALRTNWTLRSLNILENCITEHGLSHLIEALAVNSGLVEVLLPIHLSSFIAGAKKTIDEARKKRGMTAIKIKGEYSLVCSYSRQRLNCKLTFSLYNMTRCISVQAYLVIASWTYSITLFLRHIIETGDGVLLQITVQ